MLLSIILFSSLAFSFILKGSYENIFIVLATMSFYKQVIVNKNYKSLIYGVKSLIIGIPIGLILSYLIYRTMGEIYLTEYKFPIIPIIISIIFVMAIIFITMNYSVRKTKKQNIIETIRKENI